MGILFRRDLSWSDVFADHAPGWGPAAGSSASKALRLAPVYAAVSLIADLFGTLPQHAYVGAEGARRPIPTPAWLVKPDPRISLFAWKGQYISSLMLRGNAYGLVVTSPAGKPLGIRWLHPDKVTVDETDASGPQYQLANGKTETLWAQGGRIIHVPLFVQPGSCVGLNPIRNFADTFDTATAATRYGKNWFTRDAIPTSLMVSKKKLLKGQAREAKDLMRDAIADGGPVVLDGQEWDYKTLTISPADAQFLETIRASATTIATIFRVPPDDIGGDAAASRSYGNREADAERFNVRTMLPHCTRYEEAMAELMEPDQYVKCAMDALARPSLLDRSRANTENLRNGTLTLPEARALEDRPPLTEQEIAQWQAWYQTNRTAAEGIAVDVAEQIKESR